MYKYVSVYDNIDMFRCMSVHEQIPRFLDTRVVAITWCYVHFQDYVCVCVSLCVCKYVYLYESFRSAGWVGTIAWCCTQLQKHVYGCDFVCVYVCVCEYVYVCEIFAAMDVWNGCNYMVLYLVARTCVCVWFYMCVYIFTQPLHSGRIWHKVNFLAEFNRFQFRVFPLLD